MTNLEVTNNYVSWLLIHFLYQLQKLYVDYTKSVTALLLQKTPLHIKVPQLVLSNCCDTNNNICLDLHGCHYSIFIKESRLLYLICNGVFYMTNLEVTNNYVSWLLIHFLYQLQKLYVDYTKPVTALLLQKTPLHIKYNNLLSFIYFSVDLVQGHFLYQHTDYNTDNYQSVWRQHIMMILIKTITLVLNVSTYIITSTTARPNKYCLEHPQRTHATILFHFGSLWDW
jgi:hypothetical protein